jgi:hypothetical protein
MAGAIDPDLDSHARLAFTPWYLLVGVIPLFLIWRITRRLRR